MMWKIGYYLIAEQKWVYTHTIDGDYELITRLITDNNVSKITIKKER